MDSAPWAAIKTQQVTLRILSVQVVYYIICSHLKWVTFALGQNRIQDPHTPYLDCKYVCLHATHIREVVESSWKNYVT
ncbi:uncharacterized protein UV8b_05029 [Ustilaginoidea virens]|uniref:Uncharacterized protein n=1 Tax=Ustilaginoidea virens TaxID=1159556 RepID=A0A8E5HSN8_USTVR|nr:uncharacterized protein UV8b_05029 [Ustilaginoidea virens]QUC20788.1 hypothetical protein UV8b_05029 [Ustilaginoidea virens]